MNENKFSFFKAPIRTLRPIKAINLKDAYNLIVGDEYEIRTIQLRGLSGDEAK